MHESKKEHNSGITRLAEKKMKQGAHGLRLSHLNKTAIAYRIYCKYSDTLSIYHTCPEI